MPTIEPWLSGSRSEVPAIPRAVLHALDLTHEDLRRWCGDLTTEQLAARPSGLPSLAFHLRHIAGSLDRLLTYAEGRPLTTEQIGFLKAELDASHSREELWALLEEALAQSEARILALADQALADPGFWEQVRGVGGKKLPTTVGGLLVHVADHSLRHVGQAVTTAKLVRGGNPPEA